MRKMKWDIGTGDLYPILGHRSLALLSHFLIAAILCFAIAGSSVPAFAEEGNNVAPAEESTQAAGAPENEATDVSTEDDGTPVETSAPANGSNTTSVDQADENKVDPTQRADNSFIYDTSIGAISEQSTLYDNRTVQVEGEVIGDCIAAQPGYYWIELSSRDENDTANISVFISKDQIAQIDRYGRYGVIGTTLQVRGTYHQACNEHEGLADIHATNSAVVAPGSDQPDEFNLRAFLPGAVTVVIGVILLLIFRFARERMR